MTSSRDILKAFQALPGQSPARKTQPSKPLIRAAATPDTRETAALSIDAPDVCPYCNGRMRPSTAMGVDVLMCDSDRHVVPAPNAD